MEVILLKRVEKLGHMGDLVNVKPGFFRNYLLPNKFADRATKTRIEQFAHEKAQIEADNLKEKQEAEKIAARMNDIVLTFIRSASETGLLYGSIRTQEIAEAITQQGFTIKRSQISLEHPVKNLGIHTAFVVLHPEIKVPVTLNIALTQEEAMAQMGKISSADNTTAE